MNPIPRTISVDSLSSLADNVRFYPGTKANTGVTVGFKHNWYQSTLHFVNDERRMSLNYGATAAQAVFIRDALNYEQYPELREDKYSLLYEAFMMAGSKYKFKLTRADGDNVVLLKIHKNLNLTPLEKRLKEQEEVEKQRKQETTVMEKLSQKYMVEVAETLTEFVEDPTRVTLEFTNVKQLEATFLQCVLNASRPLFPQHAQLMRYIEYLDPNFDLEVCVGKMKRMLRTVTFRKEPRFTRKKETEMFKSFRLNAPSPKGKKKQTQVVGRPTLVEYTQCSPNSTQSGRNSTQSGRNSTQSDRNSPQVGRNSTQLDGNSTCSKPNSTAPMEMDSARSIDFCRSGQSSTSVTEEVKIGDWATFAMQTDQPPSWVTSSTSRTSSTRSPRHAAEGSRGDEARRANIIEALSVPVVLEKPTKMMQKMGWDGGPLGRRGDGLTEPIMPALNLVTGAGLGHVTTVDTVERAHRSKIRFRLDLLEMVLELIQSDKAEASLVAMYKFSKKDRGFIKHMMRTFSNRRKMTLADAEEARVVADVTSQLRARPHLQLAGEISWCKRILTIRKTSSDSQESVDYLFCHGSPGQSQRKRSKHQGHKLSTPKHKQLSTAEPAKEKQLAQTQETRWSTDYKPWSDTFGRWDDFSSLCPEQSTTGSAKYESVTSDDSTSQGENLQPIASDSDGLLNQMFPNAIKGLLDQMPNDVTPINVTYDYLYDVIAKYKRYAVKSDTKRRHYGMRVVMLMEILKLIVGDKNENWMIFQMAMIKKEVDYVKEIICWLNKRMMPKNCKKMFMKDICAKIIRALGDEKLSVTFDCQTKKALVFRKKLATNKSCSATEVFSSGDVHTNNNLKGIVDREVTNFEKATNYNINNLNSNVVNRGESEIIGNVINDKASEDGNKDNDCAKDETNKIKSVTYHGKGKDQKIYGDDLGDKWTDWCVWKDTADSDDDVLIIETEHETIYISDDEATGFLDIRTEMKQNIDDNVKLNGRKITKSYNIDENAETDERTVKGIENSDSDAQKSNIEGGLETVNKDLDIQIANIEANEETRGTHVENSTEIVKGNEETAKLDSGNVESNLNVILTNIEGNVDINETKNEVSAESNVGTRRKRRVSDMLTESLRFAELEMHVLNNTKSSDDLDSTYTEDVLDTDVVKYKEDYLLNEDDNETGVVVIDKIHVKVEPKCEDMSYSKDFDKDLHDLEMVLNLDDETFDCNIVKKKESKFERPMAKRSRCDSEQSTPDFKKTKVFMFKSFKNVSIVPKNYPDGEIKKECALEIQTHLSDAIDNCRELPLLKCHGIQDGGLVYSCHNEQSLFFVENCLSYMGDYKMLYDVVVKKRYHKMNIKYNCVIDNIKCLFHRLELYNPGLITDSWCVIDKQEFDDYMVICVDVDDISYEFIWGSCFCLYAGIDKVRFSVVWD